MIRKINLKDSELEELSDFLKETIGIDFKGGKLKRFSISIENLMEEEHFENFFNFLSKLKYDKKLLQKLINIVTINETYFFREKEHFEIVCKNIIPLILQRKNFVKILVFPSSSGEEVYSIIFFAKKYNLEDKIKITACDIDTNMLKAAKELVYSKKSVANIPSDLLEKYFTKLEDGYKLQDSFKKNVEFLHVNLFETNLSLKLGKFDIIFSRNMLIYFDNEQKDKAFKIFYDLLEDDGYLFMGHADVLNIKKELFEKVKLGLHVYKKI